MSFYFPSANDSGSHNQELGVNNVLNKGTLNVTSRMQSGFN